MDLKLIEPFCHKIIPNTTYDIEKMPAVPIKRNDDNATRDFILNMTPERRKELGINKSTLWYIQKKLRQGKKVKLYEKVKT
jgi:CRISPR-associated protein Cas1